MSVSSSSSRSSRKSTNSDGSVTRYRERRLPNSLAVNLLVYCAMRNPKKVTKVGVYETTWPDDYDDGESNSSRRTGYSWSSHRRKDIVLIESRHSEDWESYWDRRTVTSGRASRSSRRSGSWKNKAKVYDDEESDDGSEDSISDYGGKFPGGQFPRPMSGGPPPGAFQPVFGPPGAGGPGAAFVPPPPPGGFPMRPGGMPFPPRGVPPQGMPARGGPPPAQAEFIQIR